MELRQGSQDQEVRERAEIERCALAVRKQKVRVRLIDREERPRVLPCPPFQLFKGDVAPRWVAGVADKDEVEGLSIRLAKVEEVGRRHAVGLERPAVLPVSRLEHRGGAAGEEGGQKVKGLVGAVGEEHRVDGAPLALRHKGTELQGLVIGIFGQTAGQVHLREAGAGQDVCVGAEIDDAVRQGQPHGRV